MKPLPSLLSNGARWFGFVWSLLFLLGTALGAHATGTASATISSTPDGGNFDYTILLDNTGATPIETFWFAWVPGQDYLSSTPVSTTQPTGWVANLTGAGSSTDGKAIQWVTSTAADAVAPGATATFSFVSIMTPAQMAGDSIFDAHPPVTTSFIYEGSPLSDAGFEFTVVSVPEPSAVSLWIVGTLGLAYVGWRRAKSTF